MIEAAYTPDRLPVWPEDAAGPYQTLPSPGSHWHPGGQPVRYPQAYVRDGTAKQVTLFCPTRGEVQGCGARGCAAQRTRCSIPGCKPS